MTAEEFASRIEKVITDARDRGLSDDEMLTELDGIMDGMTDGA